MSSVYTIEDFSKIEFRRLFMKTVFGDDWSVRAFFVNEPDWGVRKDLHELDDTRGCYWSVGAIPFGKSRTNTNAENVRALVIDDVGTKLSWDEYHALVRDIGLATALVMTSKFNHQCVHRFENPLPVEIFNRFRRGLLGHIQGTSDGKDAVHLFRLPWGVNRKPGRDNYAVHGRVLVNVSPVNTLKGVAA